MVQIYARNPQTKDKTGAGIWCAGYHHSVCQHPILESGLRQLFYLWAYPIKCIPWRTANSDWGTWFPDTHIRGLNAVLGSWLSPHPALTVAGIWGIHQQMEDSFLSLVFPSPWLHFKNAFQVKLKCEDKYIDNNARTNYVGVPKLKLFTTLTESFVLPKSQGKGNNKLNQLWQEFGQNGEKPSEDY